MAARGADARSPAGAAGERPGYDPDPTIAERLEARAPSAPDRPTRDQAGHATVRAPARDSPESHGCTVQRTFQAEMTEVRRFFMDASRRKDWLRRVADGDHSEDFRRVADEAWNVDQTAPDRLVCRLASCGGPDGSRLEVRFSERDEGRTQVSLQHEGLASEAERVVMRAGWSDALDALAVRFAESRR